MEYVIVTIAHLFNSKGHKAVKVETFRSKSNWNYVDRTPPSIIMDLVGVYGQKEADNLVKAIPFACMKMELVEFKRYVIREALV